ncbi:MAG: hypothetical protein JNK14_06745 [Chitinophagaceae bacterium]|nr:hypothetical protein [Chitinophagaceae bacterium]
MYQFNEKNNVSLFLSDLQLIKQIKNSINGKIELYRHSNLGQVLIINDEIQNIEAWAPFYHEIVVHLPILFIEKIETVLIIGGGSLYAAQEVLKYESVNEVFLVDFDKDIIDLSSRYYPHAKRVLNDRRLKIVTEEAFNYIQKSNLKFDLIINDSIDLFNNAKKFVKKNVYKLLAEKTTRSGVCSDVIYRHIFEKKTTVNTVKQLRNGFTTAFSLIAIPEYPGILHLLSMWGNNSNLTQKSTEVYNKIQKGWLLHPELSPCEIYNAGFLPFYLYLPPYLKKIIER